MAELSALKERLLKERSAGTIRPGLSEADPTEAQARRELERLERQLGTMPAPGTGGDVRLRTGHDLSADAYERLRREAAGSLR
ncbi:MAG: hypothetical protein FJX72_10805 [Armatimonadetes bacterium]|nr:hypothetical protein [Armatimonadota bacterium]